MDLTVSASGHILLREGDWRCCVDPGNHDLLRAHLGDATATELAALHWTESVLAAFSAAQPPEEGPAVPLQISAGRGRAVLHLEGLLPQVEALVYHPEQDPLLAIFWEGEPVWHRYSLNVLALAAALGLTSAQLDELFAKAAELVV